MQRKNLEMSVDNCYRGVKEALEQSTKTHITITRDLALKANPKCFVDETGHGRAILPADPPPSTGISPKEKDEAIPPEWAFNDSDASGDEVPLDEVKSAMKLPFSDDMEIWRLMRKPGAHTALAEALDNAIPVEIKRSTATSECTDYLIR